MSFIFSKDAETKTRIETLLSHPGPVDWNRIDSLLLQLKISTADARASTEDDPMGRLILGKILSKNPPQSTLQAVLWAFPDCLLHNPAAFFIACRNASYEILTEMMRHTIRWNGSCENNDACPYPWIVSNLMTVEGAQALVEVFPQGVLLKSSLLSGYSPLDYFLRSPDMIEKQTFDAVLWSKFKLVLVAAECCDEPAASLTQNSFSPVHVILKRILSYPDFFDNNMQGARHVLWLLQQLCLSDRWIFEKPNRYGVYPLQFLLSHKCTALEQSGLVVARELTKILLEACPQSARYKVNKRLAIHMAVEKGWPCHDLLLAVYPEALNTPDSKTELFPFQTAAMEDDGMAVFSGLDITFELLRANPTHVRPMQNKIAGVSAQA